jgi:polysaccharide pyruvyl transferase WcaK-like protein
MFDKKKKNKIQSIILLGVSFDTGNLGVSALAWSSIKLILYRWPEAEVCVFGAGRQPGVYSFANEGRVTDIRLWPVRYTPRVWVQNHIFWIWFYIRLIRFLPFLRKNFERCQTTLAALLRADMFCDITAGDSFSDIYGMQRLIRGYLLKRVCQLTGKPFIMLPQTYGPFKSSMSRILSRKILNQAEMIYSRDQEGLAVVEGLIGKSDKTELCPDVAFVLDAIRPDTAQTKKIEHLKANGKQLIGLNISGLLYNGGYTQNNMFGLACDYPLLVKNIVSYFAQQENHCVLLVPHVVPEDFAVENDYDACKKVFQSLLPDEQQRVIVLDCDYDQNQIKYLIGLCDFFMGARMHATIAALSQCIPAVGMAYSRKFAGVFDTAGVADCVIDMRQLDEEQILKRNEGLYRAKEDTRRQLTKMIPAVKKKVLSIFQNL